MPSVRFHHRLGLIAENIQLGHSMPSGKSKMSVLLFIPDPANDSEKKFSVPVLDEASFTKSVLPIAKRVGADMVCGFGAGFEISSSNRDELERELQEVLANIPSTKECTEYVGPRLRNLIFELRRAFEDRPDVLLYIG